ncbi:MAG: bifunctional DNA-formamidopyrimidine glycosylase/DNA-(apurinic or apyrimidinic site) lyase [Patescibacteria group bacterium]
MPELPEVETVRRQLDERLRGKRLISVRLLRSGREFPVGKLFVDSIRGRTVDSVNRRAKLLIWKFDDGSAMTAHLKMTGRFVFVEPSYVPQKHDRMVFTFSSVVPAKAGIQPRPAETGLGSRLRGNDEINLVWSDIRQFGFVKLVSSIELAKIISSYGPEPLETSAEGLAERLSEPKTRTVKAALLNQQVIAGIGNIYADESLHRAGIRPTRRLGRMSSDEHLRLAQEIKAVLGESVAQQGTSANDYVDTRGEKGGFLELLRVYGREGEPCKNCAAPIKKIVLAQRGTHYCPTCQS